MMKLFFLESKFRTLLFIALIMTSLFTISCDKDDDGTVTPTTEDGIYVKGPATGFTDFKTAALMVKTRNEVLNAEVAVPRESLLELYIPVKAGSGGVNIVQASRATKTTYGAGTDFRHANFSQSNDGDLIIRDPFYCIQTGYDEIRMSELWPPDQFAIFDRFTRYDSQNK